MPSLDQSKLADDLWLAAHDTPRRKSQLADRPLSLGLGAALLGELLLAGSIAIDGGAIFLRFAAAPDDPALAPVVNQMKGEDHSRRRQLPGAHEQSGLKLREWIQYLAVDNRAHDLVTNRMSRAGLIHREDRRSLFGGVTVRYTPRDSIISGAPVSRVNVALERRHELDQSQLALAGLFLATGLHQQVFANQTPDDRAELGRQLKTLHPMLRELLRAAEQVVGEAVMLR
nr:GPP34 family phosphoprotein [uncultured Actinoplanes sp.]